MHVARKLVLATSVSCAVLAGVRRSCRIGDQPLRRDVGQRHQQLHQLSDPLPDGPEGRRRCPHGARHGQDPRRFRHLRGRRRPLIVARSGHHDRRRGRDRNGAHEHWVDARRRGGELIDFRLEDLRVVHETADTEPAIVAEGGNLALKNVDVDATSAGAETAVKIEDEFAEGTSSVPAATSFRPAPPAAASRPRARRRRSPTRASKPRAKEPTASRPERHR